MELVIVLYLAHMNQMKLGDSSLLYMTPCRWANTY